MTLESQGTCLPVVSRQESILLSLAISDYIYHDCASLLINLTVALLLRMLQYYLIVRPPLYISNLIMASGREKKEVPTSFWPFIQTVMQVLSTLTDSVHCKVLALEQLV